MRAHLTRMLEKKRNELRVIETERVRIVSYIEALEDIIRALPKESLGVDEHSPVPPKELRHGSDLSRARDALATAGKPLHISELLESIGKADDQRARVSLAGSLGALVREGRFFTRTGPNTFGLIEFVPINVENVEEEEAERKTLM